MLNRLIIKNIALIEYADIEFGAGLNVLSGETGSGKSVILDSINFILGAKADKNMIRYGESECRVQAVFVEERDSAALKTLQDLGIESDAEIIISRKFRADGRGDIRINGETVNAAMLRKVTAQLVDVHGQSDHFYLLNEANQLKVIDKIAGEPAEMIKNKLAALYAQNKEIEKKLKSLGGDESERGRRIDILKYQANEIDSAELKFAEEEDLFARKNVFDNAEKIARGLNEADESLSGDNGAIDAINTVKRAIGDLVRIGSDYSGLFERIESLSIEAEDIAQTISDLREGCFFDESEMNEVEQRIDLIRDLKKKYGGSIEKILAFRDEIGSEYDMLIHCDELYEELNSKRRKLQSEIYDECVKLSELRQRTASVFCEKVCVQLKTLNIKNAQFGVVFKSFVPNDVLNWGANGADSMYFTFSANKGEPEKPLNKVISGGEMSRLMLAIKTESSDPGGISTYIFDEIDAGISGNTAKTVAKKFADISCDKQIIAVSHLAQIVAMADTHFLIQKKEIENEKTITQIVKLNGQSQENEIIRLLGGTEDSSAARLLAYELQKECAEYKKAIGV